MVPLSGPPARVLCELAGIPPQPDGSKYGRWTWALYERFECHNLIRRYADAEPWSRERAAARAEEFAMEYARSDAVVVLLGRRVAEAFQFLPPWGEWDVGEGGAWVALPHPSGLNRTMNSPEVRALVGRVLNEAMQRGRVAA
jgi:hypothetical protein